MKLHLPKSLLIAVLAAIFAPLGANGANGWSGNTYNIDTNGTIESVTTSGYADTNGAFIRANAADVDVIINALQHVSGKNLTLSGHWKDANTNFSNLTIEELTIGENGSGSAAIGVGTIVENENSRKQQIVHINSVVGTISSLTISKIGVLTLNSATISGNVSNSGTLTLGAVTLSGTASNSGTIILQPTLPEGAESLDINSFTATDNNYSKISNSATGNIVIKSSGNKTLSGAWALNKGGKVTLKGGTFGSSDSPIKNAITSSNTVLGFEGIEAYIGKDGDYQNIAWEIGAGATVHVTVSDTFDWNKSVNWTIMTGGVLDMLDARQSVKSDSKIILAGGTIKGTGLNDAGGSIYYGLDFYNGGTITVTEDSRIETNVGGHLDATVAFVVSGGRNLTMTGSLVAGKSDNKFRKDGAGTMLYQGAVFSNALSITAGVFDFNVAKGEVHHSGAISGDGTFRKSGEGTLTLTGAAGDSSNHLGTLEVTEGVLNLGSAYIANGVDIRGGQLNIGADITLGGAINLTGGVLNLGEGHTITISDLDGFAHEDRVSGLNLAKTENGFGVESTYYTILTGLTYDDAANVSFDDVKGSVTYKLGTGEDARDIVVTDGYYIEVKNTAPTTTYVINTGTVSSAVENATGYLVWAHEGQAAGCLNITSDFGGTVSYADILTNVRGNGIIKLETTVKYGSGASTKFEGVLEIATKGELQLGSEHKDADGGYTQEYPVDYSSLSALNLNGGKLSLFYVAPSLKSMTVEKNSTGSIIYVDDTWSNKITNKADATYIEKLQLDAALTIETYRKSNINIGLLTGTANLEVKQTNGDEGSRSKLWIDGVEDYSGTITLADGKYDLMLNLNKGESIKSSQIEVVSPVATITLTGSGVYDLGSGKTETKVDGLTDSDNWHGMVKLSGITLAREDFSSYGNSESTIWLENVKGFWTAADGINENSVKPTKYNYNFHLTNGAGGYAYGQNNGWAGDYRIITGSISGDGNWGRIDSTGSNQTWEFTGDVSGWTGKIFNNVTSTESTKNQTTYKFTGKGQDGAAIVNVNIANKYINTNGEFTGNSVAGSLNIEFDNTSGFIIEGAIDATNITLKSTGGIALKNFLTAQKLIVADGVSLTLGNDTTATTVTAGTISTSGENGITIHLNDKATLNAFTKEGNGTITLTGSGVYDMGSNTTLNVSGITDAQQWNGVVKISKTSIGGLNIDSYGNASSAVEFCGVTTWMVNASTERFTNLILSKSEDEQWNGLTITGSSKQTYNLNGSVSGKGDFIIATGSADDLTYAFHGDLSAWDGKIRVDSAANSSTPTVGITLDGGGDIFVAGGNGGIEMNRGGIMNVTIGNAAEATTMYGVINNIGNGTLNLTVNGNTAFMSNVTVSQITLASGYSVSLGAGAKLTLGNDTTDSTSTIGTLVAHSGGNTIHLNKGATLNAFTKGSGSGTITLTGSGVYDLGDATKTYNSENSSTATSSQLINNNGSNFTLPETGWTGTIRISNAAYGENNKWLGLNLDNISRDGSAVELMNVYGWFGGGGNGASMAGNLILTKDTNHPENAAWTVTNGSSQSKVNHQASYDTFTMTTFNGSVSGDGKLDFAWSNGDAYTGFKFTGDISGWTGVFERTAGTNFNLTLTGNANTVNAEIKNSTSTGELHLRVQNMNNNAVATFNKDVTVSKLTLSQSATFNANLNVSGNASVANGNTLNMGQQVSDSEAGDGAAAVSEVYFSVSGAGSSAADMTAVSMSKTQIAAVEGKEANISNSLIELKKATSYTIKDIAMSNVQLQAVTNAMVNMENVSGDMVLSGGTYAFNAVVKPEQTLTTTDNTTLNYQVEGTPQITLGTAGTQVVLTTDPRLDCGQVLGVYDLVFNVNLTLGENDTIDVDWSTVVSFGGPLAELLAEQDAVYLTGTEAITALNNPYVTYDYTLVDGLQMLTVTVHGITAPEPTTATLSLIALAALAARRRRK